MSCSKKENATKDNSQRNEPELLYHVVEVGAECGKTTHLQHSRVQENARKSEVCGLGPPPTKVCDTKNQKASNVQNEDVQKMECRIVEEDRCVLPPVCDDSPKVATCGKNGGKQKEAGKQCS